jgi:hypothetical protein
MGLRPPTHNKEFSRIMQLKPRGEAGYDLVSDDGVKFGQIDIVDDTLYLYALRNHDIILAEPVDNDSLAGVIVPYRRSYLSA